MILARVSFMSTALESNSLTLKWLYSEVSSAYWTHSIDGGVTSCKCDTHMLNIIGPRMDPCGTPYRDDWYEDFLSPICTNWELSDR